MSQIVLNSKYTIESLAQTAHQLLQLNEKIILLDAPMGAGKTTLIKEMCIQLGSTDNFSSPTYQIVNEYVFPKGKIYHFDLYRLKSLNELIQLGFEDYVSQNSNYCFIEWPAFAQEFLKTDFLKVQIKISENNRELIAVKF